MDDYGIGHCFLFILKLVSEPLKIKASTYGTDAA